MPAFGRAPRPGGEPPPRQGLTAEQIRIRETFNREEHLRNNGVNGATAAPQQPSPAAAIQSGFDETAARIALQKIGFDLQVFPIGEKPLDPKGRNAYREQKLAELESERTLLLERARVAESSAAGAIRELRDLQVRFDTLLKEVETLRAAAQPAEGD